jgi:hypothetical protein
MKATARVQSKPVCEIANRWQAASSNSQPWRIFAIRRAVFSPLGSKTVRAQRCLHGNTVPNALAQEMLKESLVRLLAGIDKRARLDWSGHRMQGNRGVLARRGNPIELLLLFSPANYLRPSRSREAPWSRYPARAARLH